MDRPKFTVITVCLNSSKTIEKTIKSVLFQDYENLEYIIVDGGSTDGTIDIIKRYSTKITRILSEPDFGIYDAMNKGLKLAQGAWIHILNSDDFYRTERSVSSAVSVLNDGFVNYFGIIKYVSGREVTQIWRFRRFLLFYSAYIPHPGLIVSRSQYKIVGTYDTSYKVAADHDFILRMLKFFPPLSHPDVLAIKGYGGFALRNIEESLSEFKRVTVMNGLNPAVASLIFYFKRSMWRARLSKNDVKKLDRN